MTTYHFEDITAPLALGYKSATDTLVFSTPGATGANTFAAIAVDPTNTQAVKITLTSVPLGRAVTFGDGLKGETVNFSDGSELVIGTSNSEVITGGAGADGLYGSFGDDTLNGGAGDDVLDGGGGFANVLTGGSGSDIFIIRTTASGVPPQDTFADHITDWESGDRLAMSTHATTGLAKLTASDYRDGLSQANAQLFAQGGQYFAVAVGHDVVVFADTDGDKKIDDAVILSGRSLSDIDVSNFTPIPGLGVTPISPPPPPPPAPTEPNSQLTPISFGGGHGALINVTGSGDALDFNAVENLPLVDASSSRIAFQGPTLAFELHGNFIYSGNNLVDGTVQTEFIDQTGAGAFTVSVANISIPVPTYLAWANSGDVTSLTNAIYGGSDVITGSAGADVIRGLGGNDSIDGRGGLDSVFGGQGDDAIQEAANSTSQTYLRGEEGNDIVIGGAGFDDINGNQGDDTISGGPGDDWVVGGKDNDLQFGGQGGDIVWGNLGNDTLEGGDGDDQIRGGQGDDILFGDAGADYISGDRGNDSEVGGAGADIFHSFSGAGIDKVYDFNFNEGDRVMLDPGTTFTVNQVGQDTVIDMGAGDQMILVGVLASTLPPGTIFLG